jgi:hypothetical protein
MASAALSLVLFGNYQKDVNKLTLRQIFVNYFTLSLLAITFVFLLRVPYYSFLCLLAYLGLFGVFGWNICRKRIQHTSDIIAVGIPSTLLVVYCLVDEEHLNLSLGSVLALPGLLMIIAIAVTIKGWAYVYKKDKNENKLIYSVSVKQFIFYILVTETYLVSLLVFFLPVYLPQTISLTILIFVIVWNSIFCVLLFSYEEEIILIYACPKYGEN